MDEDIVCALGKPGDLELKRSGVTVQNTGANVVGACFVRGDTNPTSACFGGVMTRDIQVKSDYNVRARSTDVGCTAKWGVGEIADESGVKLVTDA